MRYMNWSTNFRWRCPWCNGYRRRKWTRWHEFKSWTWLIAFHLALIPVGKEWIRLFSLQLWVNSRVDWISSALMQPRVSEKENSEFKPVKLRLKNDLMSYPVQAEGLVNMNMSFVCTYSLFNLTHRQDLISYNHSLKQYQVRSTPRSPRLDPGHQAVYCHIYDTRSWGLTQWVHYTAPGWHFLWGRLWSIY